MDNLIRVYDDVVDEESCERMIKMFEDSKDTEPVKLEDGDNSCLLYTSPSPRD